jgi:ribonuclease HI
MAESQKAWVVMVDGTARGNPGPAGCGAVIYDENGVVVRQLSRYLGHTTNNVAEYEGLLMGLEAALQLGRKRIVVQSDFRAFGAPVERPISGQRRKAQSVISARYDVIASI